MPREHHLPHDIRVALRPSVPRVPPNDLAPVELGLPSELEDLGAVDGEVEDEDGESRWEASEADVGEKRPGTVKYDEVEKGVGGRELVDELLEVLRIGFEELDLVELMKSGEGEGWR